MASVTRNYAVVARVPWINNNTEFSKVFVYTYDDAIPARPTRSSPLRPSASSASTTPPPRRGIRRSSRRVSKPTTSRSCSSSNALRSRTPSPRPSSPPAHRSPLRLSSPRSRASTSPRTRSPSSAADRHRAPGRPCPGPSFRSSSPTSSGRKELPTRPPVRDSGRRRQRCFHAGPAAYRLRLQRPLHGGYRYGLVTESLWRISPPSSSSSPRPWDQSPHRPGAPYYLNRAEQSMRYCKECHLADYDCGRVVLPCPKPLAVNPDKDVLIRCIPCNKTWAMPVADIVQGRVKKLRSCPSSECKAVLIRPPKAASKKTADAASRQED